MVRWRLLDDIGSEAPAKGIRLQEQDLSVPPWRKGFKKDMAPRTASSYPWRGDQPSVVEKTVVTTKCDGNIRPSRRVFKEHDDDGSISELGS